MSMTDQGNLHTEIQTRLAAARTDDSIDEPPVHVGQVRVLELPAHADVEARRTRVAVETIVALL